MEIEFCLTIGDKFFKDREKKMILVTGGVCQGKAEIAKSLSRQQRKEHRDGEPLVVEENAKSVQELFDADVILQYHLWIRKWMAEHKDPYDITKKIMERNPNVIITLAQVGCGVVPIKAFDRQYRETVGRIGCLLAEQAREVYLVNCGLAQQIK